MKKMIIFALIMLVVGLNAQFSEGQRTSFTSIKPICLTVDITGSDTTTVYIPWPTDDWATSTGEIGTTIPDLASPQYRKEMLSTGDVHITFALDSLTRQESDSFAVKLYGLSHSTGTEEFRVETNDYTWLVLDTQGVFTQDTVDWLNWTHDGAQGVQLSNSLWSNSGFVMDLIQRAKNVATAKTRVYITIYFVR